MTRNPGDEGIWYYVWLKPNWHLSVQYGDQVQHYFQWRDIVVPLLVDHYKLSHEQAEKLSPIHTAMPRGRVVGEFYGREFTMAHGGDFPRGQSEQGEIKRLMGVFNLSKMAVLGKVKVITHDHEKMTTDHKKRLQKIIGKVPY